MYTRFFTTILLIFFTSMSSMAQEIQKLHRKNSDCKGAIFLKDTIYGPTTAPADYGNLMEIRGKKTSHYAFYREHHTVWYKFTPPTNCLFTFTIEPISIEDDYDFLLLKKERTEFCKKIRSKAVKPVRSNISRNNEAIGSYTGLRKNADKTHVNRGPGDDFSKALKVKKEDTLYLVLDNVYKGGKGHILKLNYRNCQMPEQKQEKKEEKTSSSLHFSVSIEDKEGRKPVNSDIKVMLSHNGKEVLSQKEVNHLIGKLDPDTKYKMTVRADSFFKHIETFETPAHDTTIKMNIGLTKIEKGQKLTLDNLYFHPNSANFLRKSYETLQNLLEIMRKHSTLKISVHGHVNQPLQWDNKYPPEYLQRLSDRRAEAVKRYLSRRGIDERRMQTKGFSNKEMIYPRADTEKKMKANRRVEILVLEI